MTWYDTSIQAWENLNQAFVRNDSSLMATRKGSGLYVYDLVIGIRNPVMPEDFDFGRHFNYTINKWKQLVSNYVNKKELLSLKQEILLEERKKGNIYNLAYQFSNEHKHGKTCLLSMVCSRRPGDEKVNLTFFLRASEVTKRLACDLLLFQRLGEELYGKEKFTITIHFNQIFQDDPVLMMYHVHEDVFKIIEKPGVSAERQEQIKLLIKKLTHGNPDDIKYKVHRRAAKVLCPDIIKYPTTLVKNCKL